MPLTKCKCNAQHWLRLVLANLNLLSLPVHGNVQLYALLSCMGYRVAQAVEPPLHACLRLYRLP